jgi:hypothetical protein
LQEYNLSGVFFGTATRLPCTRNALIRGNPSQPRIASGAMFKPAPTAALIAAVRNNARSFHMPAAQTPTAAPAQEPPVAPPQALPTFAKPNFYQLSGDGIDVTFVPSGAGGVAHFSYQDAQRSLQFSGDQIRKVDVPDLGTVVSVTLVLTPDSGSTTFSVLIPQVNLDNQRGSAAPVETDGITTHHRFSLVPQSLRGQLERYCVTPMSGTASLAIIPL